MSKVFGTIAQAIDVIVRHRPGITQRELCEAIGVGSVANDCGYLAEEGYVRRDDSTGVARYYSGAA